ncbi:MAG: class I SAM-dependent methyltransferase [Candidatus Glassbacteria bacterium]|nr:class I SAM-dependent methyltransferase [Candidatus Glassbacteria bacterium]
MSEDYPEIPNRFLRYSDYSYILFKQLRQEFERIYCDLFQGKVHTAGKKENYITRIHWSRDWEYPWAVVHSGVQEGHKVLDCGCGGPPFLPYLALQGVQCYGIDIYTGEWTKRVLWRRIVSRILGRPQNSLRHYGIHPQKIIKKPLYMITGSFTHLPFSDCSFDRVFCISVLEHLEKDKALQGVIEMSRVLKKEGRLLITMDYEGRHVHPTMLESLEKVIEASGLQLYGSKDFSRPDDSERPGTYDVAGLVLKK